MEVPGIALTADREGLLLHGMTSAETLEQKEWSHRDADHAQPHVEH